MTEYVQLTIKVAAELQEALEAVLKGQPDWDRIARLGDTVRSRTNTLNLMRESAR